MYSMYVCTVFMYVCMYTSNHLRIIPYYRDIKKYIQYFFYNLLLGQGAVLRRDASSSSSSSACVFSSELLADVEIPAVDESKPSTTVQVRTSQV